MRYLALLLCVLLTSKAYASPVQEMVDYLASGKGSIEVFYTQPFMTKSLTQEQAQQAQSLLVEIFERSAQSQWPELYQQISNQEMLAEDQKIPFHIRITKAKPNPEGYSLFIALHDLPEENMPEALDKAWKKQQERYRHVSGIYLTPKAPSNETGVWHSPQMIKTLERIITGMVMFANIDPKKVYLMGHNKGADAVYQLAPLMADRFAAVAVMHGHPQSANPYNLQSVPMIIYAMEDDPDLIRSRATRRFKSLLESYESQHGGYYSEHYLFDAAQAEYIYDHKIFSQLSQFQRNEIPFELRWIYNGLTRSSFYWMALNSKHVKAGDKVHATLDKQNNTITLEAETLSNVTLFFNDAMLNLDQPITITMNGKAYQPFSVRRRLIDMVKSYQQLKDPQLMFSTNITLKTSDF